MKEVDFEYGGASRIDIRDGCIDCIWLEDSTDTTIRNDGSIILTDGCNAMIKLENGVKMLVTNSEWASLNWVTP